MKRKILILLGSGILSSAVSVAGGIKNLEFIPNHRQWDDCVLYRAEMKGGKLFIEPAAVTYLFLSPRDLAAIHPPQYGQKENKLVQAHAIHVSFEGSLGTRSFSENIPSSAVYNFFLGNDPLRWASGIHSFQEIIAENIYPGIDIKYFSDYSDFRYDWIVHSGTDASAIQMKYDGCQPMITEKGELLLDLATGRVFESKPIAFQIIEGEKRQVECRYKVTQNIVAYDFPEGYNKDFDLVIDPTVIFSSYTGSLADNWGFTATPDNFGNVISGGNVNNTGYPVTTGAYQVNFGGGGTGGSGWGGDMAIAKFDATGTSLLFATYLGGSDNEEPHSIVVDSDNNIIILGITFSPNYPVTSGVYDSIYNGGGDIVISRLNSSGTSLLASTFLGGTSSDGTNISYSSTNQSSLKFNYSDDARGEVISDENNSCIVACVTQSPNFPVTAGAAQAVYGGGLQDGVVFKLDSNLQTLVWSTFLGGAGHDACYDLLEDSAGGFYVTGGTSSSNFPATPGAYQSLLNGPGIDGFITHLDSNAAMVLASTFIGTSAPDQTYFVQQDGAGDIYVFGQTGGAYPISPGVYSNTGSGQFIHKLNSQLNTSLFSTTFGKGTAYPDISPTAFFVDTIGNICAAGWGRCINSGTTFPGGTTTGLPVTANAIQSTTDGCDFYFIAFSPNAASLLFASFFGGNQSQEHVDGGSSRFDKNGILYQSVCAGCGGNSDFPTQPGVVSQTNNSFNCNNAVIKLDFNLASIPSAVSPLQLQGCQDGEVCFTVHPNPSSGAFSLEITGSPNARYRLRLFDVTGRIVAEETQVSRLVNFTNLVSGIYMVKLDNLQNNISAQKAIVITK